MDRVHGIRKWRDAVARVRDAVGLERLPLGPLLAWVEGNRDTFVAAARKEFMSLVARDSVPPRYWSYFLSCALTHWSEGDKHLIPISLAQIEREVGIRLPRDGYTRVWYQPVQGMFGTEWEIVEPPRAFEVHLPISLRPSGCSEDATLGAGIHVEYFPTMVAHIEGSWQTLPRLYGPAVADKSPHEILCLPKSTPVLQSVMAAEVLTFPGHRHVIAPGHGVVAPGHPKILEDASSDPESHRMVDVWRTFLRNHHMPRELRPETGGRPPLPAPSPGETYADYVLNLFRRKLVARKAEQTWRPGAKSLRRIWRSARDQASLQFGPEDRWSVPSQDRDRVVDEVFPKLGHGVAQKGRP